MNTQERNILITAVKTLARRMRPESVIPPHNARRMDCTGIRAALFDVYGTIMQSASGEVGPADARQLDRAACFSAALAAVGLRRPADDMAAAGVAAMRGIVTQTHDAARRRGIAHPEVDIELIWRATLDQLAARGLVKGAWTPETIRRLAVEYECRVNPAWPMPGFPEILTPLRRRGIKLGIVSNAQFYTPLLFPALTGMELSELGFDSDLCVWSCRLGMAKPAPDIFVAALRTLSDQYGIAPEETLMVGNDMLNDVAPAKKCGCRTALFAGDARSLRPRTDDERCRGVAPDAILPDLHMLA